MGALAVAGGGVVGCGVGRGAVGCGVMGGSVAPAVQPASSRATTAAAAQTRRRVMFPIGIVFPLPATQVKAPRPPVTALFCAPSKPSAHRVHDPYARSIPQAVAAADRHICWRKPY